MVEHPTRPGTAHARGHLKQPRLVDSDGAAGPSQQSHPPTWNRKVKEAPTAGSSAPPDWGSRPRVLRLADTRPCPRRPPGQSRAELGCRARATGGKRKRVGKRSRRYQTVQTDPPPWLGPGEPDRRTRRRVPLTPPAHSPGAPQRGAAAPRRRPGAAGPCPVPERPEEHRHRG